GRLPWMEPERPVAWSGGGGVWQPAPLQGPGCRGRVPAPPTCPARGKARAYKAERRTDGRRATPRRRSRRRTTPQQLRSSQRPLPRPL
ncbi:unnamed protein product, partial [Boreogadus saida]